MPTTPRAEDVRWSLRRFLTGADLLLIEVKDAQGAYFTGIMPLANGLPVLSVYVEIGPPSASRERQAIATGWVYVSYTAGQGQEEAVIAKLRERRAILAKRLRPQ